MKSEKLKSSTAKGRKKDAKEREIIIKCNFKNFNFHTLFEAQEIKVLEMFIFLIIIVIYSISKIQNTRKTSNLSMKRTIKYVLQYKLWLKCIPWTNFSITKKNI